MCLSYCAASKADRTAGEDVSVLAFFIFFGGGRTSLLRTFRTTQVLKLSAKFASPRTLHRLKYHSQQRELILTYPLSTVSLNLIYCILQFGKLLNKSPGDSIQVMWCWARCVMLVARESTISIRALFVQIEQKNGKYWTQESCKENSDITNEAAVGRGN